MIGARGHSTAAGERCVRDDEPVTAAPATLKWWQPHAFEMAAGRPDVAYACDQAQQFVDELLQSPPLRRPGPQAEPTVARLREASIHAGAALAGADLSLDAFRGVKGDGSPLALVIDVAQGLLNSARSDAAMFMATPLRALARWHVLATATSNAPADLRGRPRASGDPVLDDPLNCRIAPAEPAAVVSSLMAVLEKRQHSAYALSAAVHGLIAAGQPFAHANASIARTAARAILVARGCDPDALVPWDAAVLTAGRPKYVAALSQLTESGDEEEVADAWAQWIQWHCACIADTARFELARA